LGTVALSPYDNQQHRAGVTALVDLQQPFPATLRPAALAPEAMVSSSHPAISRAGVDVLATGGNAVDAALAMAAMSWLALPRQCGIGGDAFVVLPWSGGGSAPQIISLDHRRGCLVGGSDSRQEGVALGA
jgi:gamma-glutamyltranspeptidase